MNCMIQYDDRSELFKGANSDLHKKILVSYELIHTEVNTQIESVCSVGRQANRDVSNKGTQR